MCKLEDVNINLIYGVKSKSKGTEDVLYFDMLSSAVYYACTVADSMLSEVGENTVTISVLDSPEIKGFLDDNVGSLIDWGSYGELCILNEKRARVPVNYGLETCDLFKHLGVNVLLKTKEYSLVKKDDVCEFLERVGITQFSLKFVRLLLISAVKSNANDVVQFILSTYPQVSIENSIMTVAFLHDNLKAVELLYQVSKDFNLDEYTYIIKRELRAHNLVDRIPYVMGFLISLKNKAKGVAFYVPYKKTNGGT